MVQTTSAVWWRQGGRGELRGATVSCWSCACYLLSEAEAPGRRALGSLSEPGIFHCPGETVALLPVAAAAALPPPPFLDRLSPRSGSLSRGLPSLQHSAASLSVPLECWIMELLGEWVQSLLSPTVLSLDLPLELLKAPGSLGPSLPPSPSAGGCCPLCPWWVDLPPSFLALPLPPPAAALLAWLMWSRISSSALWGPSWGTSWGGRWGRLGAEVKWDEDDGGEKLSMRGATSDRLGEAEGRPSHGEALSGTEDQTFRNIKNRQSNRQNTTTTPNIKQ